MLIPQSDAPRSILPYANLGVANSQAGGPWVGPIELQRAPLVDANDDQVVAAFRIEPVFDVELFCAVFAPA